MTTEERYRRALMILADNLYGGGDFRPISHELTMKMVKFIDDVLNGKTLEEAMEEQK